MQGILDRLQTFSQAVESLQNSNALMKPLLFIRYADKSVVADTLTHSRWGFVFTLESLAYMLIGMFLGHFLFSLIKRLGRKAKPSSQKTT
jgi:hypothetical protein